MLTMATTTSDLVNEYKSKFNGEIYLQTYYQKYQSAPFFTKFILNCLHGAFTTDIPESFGHSLLEIGIGPVVSNVIPASRRFKNIVLSDLVESNQELVRKWLQKDPGAPDFKHLFQFVAALELEKDYRKLEERVREVVKEVIPCNVHLPNPIAPKMQHFDVIVSSYCLDAASSTVEDFKVTVSNVASLLNPGGYLALFVTLQCQYYDVGKDRLPVVCLEQHDVDAALCEANLHICECVLQPVIKAVYPADFSYTSYVLAKK